MSCINNYLRKAQVYVLNIKANTINMCRDLLLFVSSRLMWLIVQLISLQVLDISSPSQFGQLSSCAGHKHHHQDERCCIQRGPSSPKSHTQQDLKKTAVVGEAAAEGVVVVLEEEEEGDVLTLCHPRCQQLS